MDRYKMLPTYNYYDVEGNSSLTLDKSVGKPLRDYKIYGNSIQDGTPSPEAPVEIGSCGERTKNLFDVSKITNNSQITNNGDSSITCNGYSCNTVKTLSQLCPDLKVGDTIIMRANTTSWNAQLERYMEQIYLVEAKTTLYYINSQYGNSLTITQEHLDSQVCFYGGRDVDGGFIEGTVSNIQITKISLSDEENLFNIGSFVAIAGSKYYSTNEQGELIIVAGDYRNPPDIPSFMTLPAGTYLLMLPDSPNSSWRLYINDTADTVSNSRTTSYVFTLKETSTISLKFWMDANTNVGKVYIKDISYEPYGYKIPIEVNGKNLFNEDDFIELYTPYHTSSSTITTKTEFDGYKCLKVWGAINTNGLALEYMKGQFKENTQYTFSVDAYDVLSNKMYGASLGIVYTDGTKTTYNLINSSGDDRIRKAEQWCTTVTTSAYGKTISHLLRGFGTGGGYTYIKNFQIEEAVNLFDSKRWVDELKNNSSNNSYYPIVDKDEEYEYIKVSPGGNNASLVFMEGEFKENTQYTLSFMCRKDKEGTCPVGLRFRYTDGTEQIIRNTFNSTDWIALEATSAVNKTILGIRIYYEVGDWGYYANIHLGEGTATDYEPYKEPIKTNIYLDEPLYNIATHKDYITYLSQKIGRYNKQIVLNGTEGCALRSGNTHTFIININDHVPKGTIIYNGKCSHYPDISGSDFDVKSGIYVSWTANLPICDLTYDNVDDFKAYVKAQYDAGTPITLMAQIATEPVEEDIKLPSILTYKGTNVISVDTTIQPSNILLEYYK